MPLRVALALAAVLAAASFMAVNATAHRPAHATQDEICVENPLGPVPDWDADHPRRPHAVQRRQRGRIAVGGTATLTNYGVADRCPEGPPRVDGGGDLNATTSTPRGAARRTTARSRMRRSTSTRLRVPLGSSTLINVTGESYSTATQPYYSMEIWNGTNYSQYGNEGVPPEVESIRRALLWNFPQATEIQIGPSLSWQGSVLAPGAAVVFPGDERVPTPPLSATRPTICDRVAACFPSSRSSTTVASLRSCSATTRSYHRRRSPLCRRSVSTRWRSRHRRFRARTASRTRRGSHWT